MSLHLPSSPSATPESGVFDPERPSRHGAIMGQALIALADADREASGVNPDQMCATCAFRPGAMTNQMAATGLIAYKCAIGADPAEFACHHSMKDGETTRLCTGYLMARAAPFETVRAISEGVCTGLDLADGPDTIRDDFDAWLAKVDPDNQLDNYRRARLYAKRRAGA